MQCSWAAQKNPLNGLSKPFMNSLSWMDVSNNMLSGRVPDFGTSNPPPYFIMNGAQCIHINIFLLMVCHDAIKPELALPNTAQ